jgi:hypothetical protein
LAGKDLEEKVVTDDVIRIKPTKQATIAPGYLATALSRLRYGRPIVKALAYGSSIPHIEVVDIESLEIVRLDPKEESAIAGLAEQSARARATADIIEREIASDVRVPRKHSRTRPSRTTARPCCGRYYFLPEMVRHMCI